jgi:glucosylceramidase
MKATSRFRAKVAAIVIFSVHLLATLVALLSAGARVGAIEIVIDESQKFQPVNGVGAALTESTVTILLSLSSADRRELLKQLFAPSSSFSTSSTVKTANFNMVRVPISSCDLDTVAPLWTYDDSAGDFKLLNFSIDHSQLDGTIQVLQEILSIRPDLKIMLTPWSAPGWLKLQPQATPPIDPFALNGGNFSATSDNLRFYAQLFGRVVEDFYTRFGIKATFVSLQNEPQNSNPSYPTMWMTSQQQAQLAAATIRVFDNSKIVREITKTQILLLDHNWDLSQYVIDALESIFTLFPSSSAASLVQRYVAGAAWHCYGGDVSSQSTFYNHFDGQFGNYFTECSGGGWAPDFASDLMWDVNTLSIASVNNFAQTVLKWNLILNEQGGPRITAVGGCANCRGVLTFSSAAGQQTFQYNEDFAALAHLSNGAFPATARIGSTVSNNISNNGNVSVASLALENNVTSQVSLLFTVSTSNSNATSAVNSISIVRASDRCVATLNYNFGQGAVVTAKYNSSISVSNNRVEWIVTMSDQSAFMEVQKAVDFVCS